MKTVKRTISGIVGAGTALFLAAMQQAHAAGPLGYVTEHPKRIIAGVVVLLVIVVVFVLRARSSKKQTA